MRKTNNKGQMRVVESILASLFLLVAVGFLYQFVVTPSSQSHEPSELEKTAYNVLQRLDEQRLLGSLVYSQKWDNLTLILMASLPSNTYFSLTIYDANGHIINSVPIGYGDPDVFENSGSVASVSYGLPGFQTNYNPRILVLQLVRG